MRLALTLAAAMIAHAQGTPGTGTLAEEEPLKGTIDGINQAFTLAHAPVPWISLKVFRNGLRMTRCRNGATTNCDYTLVAPWNKLIFVPVQTATS